MEQPAKRQKTLSKACEACKQRKQKCDSARPQCQSCRNKRVECIYRERSQPGLRPGYGKGVEQRLGQLEEAVRDISNTLRSLTTPPSAIPTVSTSRGIAPEHQMSSPPATNYEHISPSATANLSTTFDGGPPMPPVGPPDPPSDPQSAATGPQLAPTMQQQQSANLAQESMLDTDIALQLEGPSEQPTVGNPVLGLPSSEVLEELARLFFRFVAPSVNIFHEPTFTANLFAPERTLLLHAITVVAFRFWDKPSPDAATRERHIQLSKDEILLRSTDSVSLVSTQALVLLAVDSFASAPGTRTASIMALLTCAMHYLGLMRRPLDENQEASFILVRNEHHEHHDMADEPFYIEEEERRRLFWMVFSLDRFTSLSHGTQCIINAGNINQRFPGGDSDWGSPSTAEFFRPFMQPNPSITTPANPWRYFIEVTALLDRTHQFLLQPVNLSLPVFCQEWQSKFRVLDMALHTWWDYLPATVRERPVNYDPMWIMIHSTFYAVIIRMHSIAAFPPTTSAHFKGSPAAARRCRQAVDAMTSLLQPLTENELDHLGPMCAFLVWIACRNLVIVWTAEQDSGSGVVPANLTTLLDVLKQLARRWQCAQRYADLVQLILDTRKGTDGEARLRIFNDTRRTAYGIHHLLGARAAENQVQPTINPCDWLDMSFFDQFDISTAVPAGPHDLYGSSMVPDWASRTV